MSEDRLKILLEVGLGSGIGELQKLETSLKNLDTYSTSAQAGLKKITDVDFGRLSSQIDSVAGGMQKIGTAMSLIGVPMGLIAKESINMYADLESQIQRNTALLGGGKAEYEQILALSKELGASSPFDALEIGAGIEALAAAGYSLQDIQAAMPTVTEMAVATGEDLNSMSEILIATLNSYGESADMAGVYGDKLATIANISSASITDFGESMKYVGGIADAFGVDIDELGAVIGALADVNIKGSMAGTGLRSIITDLASPTAKINDIFASFGLTMDDLNPKVVDFVEILQKMKDAGVSDEALMAAFGDRGGVVAVNMLSQLDKVKANYETLQNDSVGMLKEFSAQMRDTLKFVMDEMGGTIANIMIEIGEGLKPIVQEMGQWLNDNQGTLVEFAKNAVEGLTPFVEKFMSLSAKLMEWFNSLPDDMQSKVAGLTGLGSAMATIGGPLLLLGSLPVSALAKISGGIDKIKKSVTGSQAAATELMILTDAINALAAAQVASVIDVTPGGDKSSKRSATKGITSMADETLVAADVLGDAGSTFLLAGEKYERDAAKTKEKIKTAMYWDDINSKSSYTALGDNLLGTEKSTVTLKKRANSIVDSFDFVDAALTGSILGSEVSSVNFKRNAKEVVDSVDEVADGLKAKKIDISDSLDIIGDAFSLDSLSKQGTVKKAVKELADDLDEIPSRFSKIADPFKNVGETVAASVSKFSSSTKTALSTAKTEMLLLGSTAATELTAMLSTLPGIGVAIAGAAAIGIAAYMTNFGDFRDNVNDIMAEIGSAVNNINTGNYEAAGRDCAQAFANGLESVADLAVAAITSIPDAVKAFDEMSRGFDAALSEISVGFGQGLRNIVDEGVASFSSALSSASVDVSSFVSGIITQITSQDWSSPGDAIGNLIGAGINGSTPSISGFIDGIASQLTSFDWEGLLSKTLLSVSLPGLGPVGSGVVGDVLSGFINPKSGNGSTGTQSLIDRSIEQIANKLIEQGVTPHAAQQQATTQYYQNRNAHSGGYRDFVTSEDINGLNKAIEQYAKSNDLTYEAAEKLYKGSEKTAASIENQYKNSSKPQEVTGEVSIKTGTGTESKEKQPWEGAKDFEEWSRLGGSLDDWNNRMDEESESVEESASSTTKSTGRKSKATEKITEAFDAATSKEEALAQVIEKYGSIDAAKKAVESVTIGDKEYDLSTSDGTPVLKAANDYTKSFDKKADDLLKGIGVIEKYASGTTFQDAINKTLDKYGTGYQGQIQIGNALYDVAKKATGDSFDENGNFDEWSFYLKGANDLAKQQIDKLDDISTGEVFKSGDKKGQQKTKNMSADEWAEQTGVVRKATKGTAEFGETVDGSSKALDDVTKQLYKFEDGSSKWMTSAEAVQQWGFDPLKESGAKTSESLDSLASSADGVDIDAMFREIIAKADLGGIIAEALKENANMSIGRNADADERKEFIDLKERTFYSEAASKAAEMYAWGQYKGSNEQDTIDSIKTELGALFVQYNKGLPIQNTSYGWARDKEVRDSLTGSEEHIVDLMAQEYYQKIQSGKYEVQRYNEFGEKKELTGPWSQNDRYGLVEIGKEVKTTGTEAKTTTPQINTLNSAFEKIGLTGTGLSDVLSNVDQALSDHRASILESEDYLSKYNQAAGENTKYTQDQERQTYSLMNSLGMLGTAQDMYNNYMSDGVLDATEAASVQQALAAATKMMGDAGITAEGGISGLPGALQALASAAQQAMSQIQAAISMANAQISNVRKVGDWTLQTMGGLPTIAPSTQTNFNINMNNNTFPTGTNPGEVFSTFVNGTRVIGV